MSTSSEPINLRSYIDWTNQFILSRRFPDLLSGRKRKTRYIHWQNEGLAKNGLTRVQTRGLPNENRMRIETLCVPGADPPEPRLRPGSTRHFDFASEGTSLLTTMSVHVEYCGAMVWAALSQQEVTSSKVSDFTCMVIYSHLPLLFRDAFALLD